VQKFAADAFALLRRFCDCLPCFRVIANYNEAAMIRWHWLHRIRRADDREPLHCECKAKQDAKGERFHIAVSLCIIRAIEIPILRRGLSG